MRKLCLVILFLALPLLVLAQNIPQPSGSVNDFAAVISQEYKDKLNALIQELNEKTSAEIAVVTVSSIAPYEEKMYARMLFDSWKPGKKEKDNGVLVLLAVKERRWRIETGYGVEGVLPDGLCGEIGRNYMVPYFKQGDYAQGLYYGVASIARVIAKDANIKLEGVASTENTAGSEDNTLITLLIFLIFLAFIIFNSVFSSRLRRRGNYYGAGAWGAGSGGFGGGSFGGGGFGGGGGGGGGAGGGF